MTRWASQVTPTNALPEYPRPQLARADWLNLNGLWDYAISTNGSTIPSVYQGQILVPFPLESALSGVMTNLDEHSFLWYHRSVSIPASWRGRRVRLNFGAVDWSCEVVVNGHLAGRHQGGFDRFAFDITDFLRWSGVESLVIRVMDPTEGDQPRGKQSRKPEGIFYTPASGIWQTVWLEPVAEICVERLKLTPDVDAKALHLVASVHSLSDDLQVEAVALAGTKEVARSTGSPDSDIILSLPNPQLWSPDAPFLYELHVTLRKQGIALDSVASYFAMRKIGVAKDDQGVTRIALNDKFLFEIGTLDQGFWPDGIYTAPTDEALRSDIEFLRKAGFNLTRKHVKVEPERWYYWCDKLGLLVWQDMPSANNATVEGRRDFETELLHMVEGLRNHPSIIVWILFNEGWGQYDTESLAKWLKELDPSRLVDNASGWTDMRAGDLADMHNYPGPGAPVPEAHRAAVLGEFGGFGLSIPEHSWSPRYWGYVMLTDKQELASRYVRALKQVWRLHALRGLSAAVYTQTSDVETECNGLLTYDRAMIKLDPGLLLAANRGTLSEAPVQVFLPTALLGQTIWKFSLERPAENWTNPSFDDAGWKKGPGGFGTPGTPGIIANTVWDTSDIWLRNSFSLKSATVSGLKLQLFHDEDVEVYFNGILALQRTGFITDYDDFEPSQEALNALHAGSNSIAVHCHQTTAGQGVDVGVVLTAPLQPQ